MPTEIDEVERRIQQLEIEHQALKKETEASGVARREAIERELAELRERSSGMKATWQAEKEAITAIRELKLELEQAHRDVERAERDADLERAAELRYGRIPDLQAQLAEAEERSDGDAGFLKEEVDDEDVAEVVAKWTGIPVSRLLESEVAKLIHMEERLHDRVIGQDDGGRGRVERAAPLASRAPGPRSPDRHLPVHGPDRRRQDRARAGARRVHVRQRAGDGPHRHVRVHGEARGVAARRRASRLRRLRRGRPADRGGAPPAVCGRAARRDREGARRRVQHPAAGDGRRAPDRRPGPHGRLHEHGPDHDLERRGRDGRRARHVQARVREPPRRGRSSSSSSAASRSARSSTSRSRR